MNLVIVLHTILTNEMNTYKSHSGINPFTLDFIKMINLAEMRVL